MGNRNRTIICLLLFAWGEQTNAAPRHFAGYMESADSPQVQFRRLGVTSASTEFGHIIIDFDIHMLDANLQQVIRHMPKQDARLKDKEPHHSFKLDLLHRHAQSLEGRLTTVKLAGVQPTQVNLIREKRFAFTIGIVAVTALLALTAGLYATAEVKAIRRKATQIGAEQKEQILLIEAMLHASQDLAQVVDRIPEMVYTDKFGAEAKVAYFELILQQIGEKIALAENAVRAAALGKLDITTINAAGFTNALYSLRRFADKNSLALVTENLNDFLHVPTSITQSEDGFSLIAHVPLIDPTSTMIVYQHMRLPMPAGEGFFYQLEADTDVIAIHPDESMFKEMSMVEADGRLYQTRELLRVPERKRRKEAHNNGLHEGRPRAVLVRDLHGDNGDGSHILQSPHNQPGTDRGADVAETIHYLWQHKGERDVQKIADLHVFREQEIR